MKPTSLIVWVALAGTALAAAQEAAAPDSAGHAWQQAQRPDPAGTYTFTRFTLAGSFVDSPSLAQRPALTVDCIPSGTSGSRAKFLTANLLVGRTLKIDWVEPQEIRGTSYFPKVSVAYQLDAAASSEQQWSAGTDRVPTGRPSDKDSATIPRDALRKFLRAHTVTITAADEHGAPLEMRFDIPDSKALEAACRLD